MIWSACIACGKLSGASVLGFPGESGMAGGVWLGRTLLPQQDHQGGDSCAEEPMRIAFTATAGIKHRLKSRLDKT